MAIAIAVSQEAPDLPPGERTLLKALHQAGIDAAPVVWSREADWAAFSTVVIRSCWDYHMRIGEFLAWIARLEQLNVALINSASLIRWNADKRYLAELAAKGVRIPDTHWLARGETIDLAVACGRRGWPMAVVKPLVSASAYRTERRSEGVVEGPMMIQEYVREIEQSGEWSLVYFSGVFSHAVRKLPRAGDFRVQKELGGTARAADPPDAVKRAADSVLAALAIPPVIARVDVVERSPEILLMELELIEPELFLDLGSGSIERLVSAILAIKSTL